MKIIVLLLLSALSAFAQLPEAPKPQKVITWDFIASETVNWGGTLADGAISMRCVNRRTPEGNELFAGPNGQFKAGKFFAINGAIAAGFTAAHVIARKYAPRSKAARVLTDLTSAANGVPHWVAMAQWRQYCSVR